MTYMLIVLKGPDAGQVFAVDPAGDAVIGRDGQAVALSDTKVSRRQAAVVSRDGQLLLEEFGSANGTFVNRQPVKGRAPLKPGDQIQVGRTLLAFGEAGDAFAATAQEYAPPPQAIARPSRLAPALAGGAGTLIVLIAVAAAWWVADPMHARAMLQPAVPAGPAARYDDSAWRQALAEQTRATERTDQQLAELAKAVQALADRPKPDHTDMVAAIDRLATQDLKRDAAQVKRFVALTEAIEAIEIPEVPSMPEPAPLPQPLRVTDDGRTAELLEKILTTLQTRPIITPASVSAPAAPAPAPPDSGPADAEPAPAVGYGEWAKAQPIVRTFAQRLLVGEYDAAARLLSARYRKDMPPEQMQQAMAPMAEHVGAFRSIAAHDRLTANDDGSAAWRTQIHTDNEARLTLTVSLDAQGRIEGLFLQRKP